MAKKPDYWTKLKLNEAWSDRKRFNIMMDFLVKRIDELNKDG